MTTKQFKQRMNEAKKHGNMLIFAHRGVCSLAAENSVKALTLGFHMKEVDGVEFDVQQTKDGVLIVRHHRAVRTGNKHEWLRDMTLHMYRQYVSEEASPLFSTVLSLAKHSKKMIDIEIKQDGIAKKIIEMCSKEGVYARVILTTIYPEVYTEIRKIDPTVAVIFGYPRDRGKDMAQQRWTHTFVKMIVAWMRWKTPKQMKVFAQTIDTPFYSLYHKVTSKRAVDAIHQLGKLCIGCTISLHNDTGEKESIAVMNEMIRNGVDMIKTDYPQVRNQLVQHTQ